ncbi:SpoIIIAH-like family protein [Clostridium vincentii]|uniref:SpoIIIAH-like protein n=1 Tax=Clostridium vincentii TaxID=52704 RepID=A0A2T0BGC2_9CLOT|nr:SpoIIIAH-like family protein [Clostridium vincentii]PRR82961.1 SpoIIIAH-like protein [Clostridium vincentii]
MTKKQLGIICTLLALIVCTAILAAKLNNGGLNDPSDLSAVLSAEDGINEVEEATDTETISQQDFFIDSRSEREQKDATTVQSLKAIADNENTSAEQKASATDQLQTNTLKQDKQKTIELNIKNKGYVDALCEISEDQKQASIIVNAEDGLSEKDGAVIQEIVQNAANIKDVTIEVKK